MTYHRRAPRRLGAAVSRAQARIAPQTLLSEVQQVWASVVGEGLAQRWVPTSVRSGVVYVECDDAGWAEELKMQSTTVVEKLNRVVTRGQVTDLRPRIR